MNEMSTEEFYGKAQDALAEEQVEGKNIFFDKNVTPMDIVRQIEESSVDTFFCCNEVQKRMVEGALRYIYSDILSWTKEINGVIWTAVQGDSWSVEEEKK